MNRLARNSCRSFSTQRCREAKIISNIKIKSDYYKLTLNIGRVSCIIKPGQFFSIRCSDRLNPLLRRPFSVHRIKAKGELEFLYKVIGSATIALSKKKKDNIIDIIGPLGNSFDYQLSTILIGGGIGVAPLLFLAEKVTEVKNPWPASQKYSQGRQKSKIKNLVVIGAKTKKELLCEDDFKSLGFEVLVATEDGSNGKKALATDVLKHLLSTLNSQLLTIYACGPNAMLKEIAKIATMNRIDAYGSFEEHMACGVGSCYGCVIKTTQGYKRVCHDGPVFNLKEIIW